MKINLKPRKARIELIPLLDMIFLVLVSFVYTFISMTVQKGIPVNLPYAKSSLETKKKFIVVTITERNEIFLDKEMIQMNSLTGRLRNYNEKYPDVKVFLNADKNIIYDYIIKVIDAVRDAGINKVSLQTAADDG